MRAYIDGNLSRPNNEPVLDGDCFIPSTLWFANTEDDYDLEVSETCLRLDAQLTESGVQDSEFSCRWKGIEICYINDDGVYIETEDFTLEDFVEIIKEKNMNLVNMEAYYDADVNVRLTSLLLVDKGMKYEFDVSNLDEIEFVE